jgi:hypothetical protein
MQSETYPDRTDAIVVWDIENVHIPKDINVPHIYEKFLLLNDKYNIDIKHIMVMGNNMNIKQENIEAFKKYNFEYVDTKSGKKHKADLDIQLKILELSKEKSNSYHVFILISSDGDFIGTLESLRKNPLHKTILIHLDYFSSALLESADITINWYDFIDSPRTSDSSTSYSSDDERRYKHCNKATVKSNYGCYIRFCISDVKEKFIASGSLALAIDNVVTVEYHKNGKLCSNLGKVESMYKLPSRVRKESEPHNITILASDIYEYKLQQRTRP